jgi:hypothetical protein
VVLAFGELKGSAAASEEVMPQLGVVGHTSRDVSGIVLVGDAIAVVVIHQAGHEDA